MKKNIRKYLSKWRKILKIDPQWEITFQVTDDENVASIAIASDHMSACILIDKDVDEKILEHVILHELLELCLSDIGEVYGAIISPLIDGPTRITYDNMMGHARNRFIEKIISAAFPDIKGKVPFGEEFGNG